MTTLYLIRHGETRWNRDGRFQGQQNSPLSESGRAQACAVAQALAAIPLETVYTSDLGRAMETARAVAAPHRLTPVADARLREAHFGEWEGLTLPEITARWPEVVAAWRRDSLRTRPPGGETLEQVQQRVAALVADVRTWHPDGQVALVGHTGSMRAVVTLALGADLALYRRFHMDNCSISIVRWTDDRSSLVRLNDICHLRNHAADSAG